MILYTILIDTHTHCGRFSQKLTLSSFHYISELDFSSAAMYSRQKNLKTGREHCMKIAFFERIITPETGVDLGGYGVGVTSVAKHDDIYVSGICLDDGNKKALLLSFDLLGLEGSTNRKIRQACADALNIGLDDVILSCTHTHNGPIVPCFPEIKPDTAYFDHLAELCAAEAGALIKNDSFMEVRTFFYSIRCPENINRRVINRANIAMELPSAKSLLRDADGICDDELGMLIFYRLQGRFWSPVYSILNYAAHPLTAHVPSGCLAGHSISADYPGVLREFIKKNTGFHSMFLTGAAGDMFPREYEMGFESTRRMGEALGRAALEGLIDALRNPDLFELQDPRIRTMKKQCRVKTRSDCKKSMIVCMEGKKEGLADIQFLAVGEVCFVGMPGELLAECGLEIKWNSPFRKTFILFNSTGHFGYLPHANVHVSKGFEYKGCRLSPLSGFRLVETAVHGLFELHDPDELFEMEHL